MFSTSFSGPQRLSKGLPTSKARFVGDMSRRVGRGKDESLLKDAVDGEMYVSNRRVGAAQV